METDAQGTASLSRPHAHVTKIHHTLAGLTVQSRSADADVKPTKKRRTESPRTQISPSEPHRPIHTRYTGAALGLDGHGTKNANGTSGLSPSNHSPCSPGDQHPVQLTEACALGGITHHEEGLRQKSRVSDIVQHDTPANLFFDADTKVTHRHPPWSSPPTSPPGDQITAGSLPHPSLSLASVNSSVAGDRVPSEQPHGRAICHPLSPAPTPPPFIGTKDHQHVGIPLGPSHGRSALATGQPGYGHGTNDGNNCWSSLQDLKGALRHGSTAAPEFDQGGNLHPFPSDRTSASNANGIRILENPVVELSEPGGPSPAPLDGGGRIKQESSHAQRDRRGSLKDEAQSTSPYLEVTDERPTLDHEPDGEGSRDRKKRARFDESLRKETSNTRSMGACLRCHNQRVRCVPNKLDSENPYAPCETCRKVRKDSKKTIHNVPCVRFKVTSMAIYRPGGLGFTERFDHTKVTNVTDYIDNIIHDIRITQGLCRRPLRLRVRQFRPRKTDVTHRRYMDDGTPKIYDAGAFCLADVETTAKEFGMYVDCNALRGLAQAMTGSDRIVQDVFAMIDTATTDNDENPEEARKALAQKVFLQKLVRLWFAIRHGVGSAWICGQERLGLEPAFGHRHPLSGKQVVPRMIVAQFDSIRCVRIYKKLFPEVLRTLETLLASCNKEAWFTVFLATFLLLHQTANTSMDRYRYTKEYEGVNPRESRYGELRHPLTAFVEEVHHSAVMLLAHWQYFKRCDLMNVNWDDVGDSVLSFLEPYQVNFVRDIVGLVKEKIPSIPTTPDEGCWEHELFWVSRMFLSEPSGKADWTPPEMFTRAKPSIGRE